MPGCCVSLLLKGLKGGQRKQRDHDCSWSIGTRTVPWRGREKPCCVFVEWRKWSGFSQAIFLSPLVNWETVFLKIIIHFVNSSLSTTKGLRSAFIFRIYVSGSWSGIGCSNPYEGDKFSGVLVICDFLMKSILPVKALQRIPLDCFPCPLHPSFSLLLISQTPSYSLYSLLKINY